MMTKSLEKLWQELSESDESTEGYFRKRILEHCPCGVFVAVEKPSNRRALLFDIDASKIPSQTVFAQSEGFVVLLTPLEPGPNGKVRIALIVSGSSFNDVFAVLAQDIINRITAFSTQEAVVMEFAKRLSRWQAFLRKHPPEGLSELEQLGLYGEIWFLLRCLRAGISPEQVVASWVGPTGASQDFQFPHCAVEIKTTTSVAAEFVRIANLRQLDGTGVAHLFLMHLAFDSRPGEILTLADLIDEVDELLRKTAPSCSSIFQDSLIEAGYLAVHRNRYCTRRFTLRSESFYEVIEGFPRIIEGDVSPSINDVNYVLSLDACLRFRAAADFVMATARVATDG
jgi:hypothetical protein